MQTDAGKIRELLKKTSHYDKDERFMATSDLIVELEKVEGRLDASLQSPIRDAILKQLDDASNDVQAIACRCLSAIVQKFNADQVEEIVDKLGILLIKGKMSLRDIYTIALKNIISSVPEDFGQQISSKLIVRLIEGLQIKLKTDGESEKENQEYEMDHFNRIIACLDIMKDLVTRFGYLMSNNHQEILNTIQPMLNGAQIEVRKKTAVTLGAVVAVVNDDLFKTLMNNVITQISKTLKNDEKLFTYIQAIGVFSRNAGKRISVYLKDIVPLLMDICNDKKLNEEVNENAIELRENCLQAFETLIVQCPKEIRTYANDILNVGLKLMKFDPLYSYDDENEAEMKDSANKEDEENEDGGEDWGDEEDKNDGNEQGWDDNVADDIVAANDDDITWKVRRASIKMLAAFIQTHKAQVQEFQIKLCDELLNCFREHDVNVKLEIFDAFRELLLASIIAEHGATLRNDTNLNPFELPPLIRQNSAFELMSEKLDDIMKKIIQQFSSNKNVQIKQGLLNIIGDLVLVRQAQRSNRCAPLNDEGLYPYFDSLIPQIIKCINDNDLQLKTKAVYVLYIILTRHRSQECIKAISLINEVVIACVKNDYSRVKAQALYIISRIVEVIRPMENGSINYDKKFDKIVTSLFKVTFEQLELKDIEQEVKKAALDAVAKCIAHFGDLLQGQVSQTLEILLNRLTNEVTRQTALQAFAIIATSPLNVDLSKCVDIFLKDSSPFLKKHSTSLKINAALALKSVLKSSGTKASQQLISELIQLCTEFINDGDLHLCHLILDLLTQIMLVQKTSLKEIANTILPCIYKFLQSPLLQGYALESLRNLLETFMKISQGGLIKFDTLKDELIKAGEPKLSRQSYSAIAKCLATLILNLSNKMQESAVNDLIKLISSKNDEYSQIALLCIGELGKSRDLSIHDGIEDNVFDGFTRENESIKWAASFALGNMAVGNMEKYIPVLLDKIENYPERQYLLLNSLKEIISVHSNNIDSMKIIKPYSKKVIPLLLNNASSDDEGVRAMVAECVGKFAVIDDLIFEEIEKLLNDNKNTTKSTMVASLKFSLNKFNNYNLPDQTISKFLKLLNDKDLIVKRQSFLTLNTILHVNSRLVSNQINNILPIIYNATVTDESLIREVDLGPFKHRVDDGLPLRKAAFQCLDTLLDSSSSNLIYFTDYIKYLANGINDESPDIQMQTYQVMTRLAQNYGNNIVKNLDDLPDTLMTGIKDKMNDAKGNKDTERSKDILKAAVKALWTMRNIPNINQARKFVTFYSRVEKTKILIPMLEQLQKESQQKKY